MRGYVDEVASVALEKVLSGHRLETVATLFSPGLGWGLNYPSQLLALSPSDAKIQEVTPHGELADLSRRLDRLTLQILSTPTGRNFCAAVPEDVQMIKRVFFLHDESATQALRVCRGHFAKTLRLTAIPFPKRYFVVLTEQKDFLADGWTNPRKETFLFLNKHDIRDDRLIRTLAHELAVSLDLKELFGWLNLRHFNPFQISLDNSYRVTTQILRNVFVKHALTSIRAFEIEARIASELGLAIPQGLADFHKLGCLEKIDFLIPYILPLAQALEIEAFTNSMERDTDLGHLLTRPKVSGQTFEFMI